MASSGIGDRLQNARTARGLSLDDIAAETHIRRDYLDALEREAWDELPGPTYVKGFLDTYTRQLGLPAAEIAGLYQVKGKPSPPVRPVPRAVEVRIMPATSQSRLRRIVTATAVLLIAGAVVLAYVLIAQLRQFAATRPTPATTAAPGPAVSPRGNPATPGGGLSAAPVGSTPAGSSSNNRTGASGTPSTVPGGTPEPGSQPAVSAAAPIPVAGETIVLSAQATDRSWVRVVSDGSVVFEGFLSAGDHQVWQGRHQLTIRVGNASALDLTVNRQPLGRLGNPGDVVDRTFTSSTLPTVPPPPASAPPKAPAPPAAAPSAPPPAPPAGSPSGPPTSPGPHQ
jgi:cytoskeleton protein RodZ